MVKIRNKLHCIPEVFAFKNDTSLCLIRPTVAESWGRVERVYVRLFLRLSQSFCSFPHHICSVLFGPAFVTTRRPYSEVDKAVAPDIRVALWRCKHAGVYACVFRQI